MTATSIQVPAQHSQPRLTMTVIGFAAIAILAAGLAIGLSRSTTHNATIAEAVVPGAVLPDRGVTIGTFNAEYAPVLPDRGVVIGTFNAVYGSAGPDSAARKASAAQHSGSDSAGPDSAARAASAAGFAAGSQGTGSGHPTGSVQNASAANLDLLNKTVKNSVNQGGGAQDRQN